jgi:hypothetical protein
MEAMQDREQALKESKEAAFLEMLGTKNNLEDHLTEFATFLWNSMSCTGVYIGSLEQIKLPIDDEDSETAHKDPEGKEIITYVAACDNHEFLVGKTLASDQGPVTYQIWKEQEPGTPRSGESSPPVASNRLNTTFVPNVIKQPDLHYYDVPKLGCYLAVPLDYDSCLFERSFTRGVENTIEVRKKRADQEQEKLKSERSKGSQEEAEELEPLE